MPNRSITTYPCLLTIGSHEVYTPTEPIDVFQPNKEIALHHLTFAEEQTAEKANWLLDQVKNGGIACWIANTVSRAQEIFTHLQDEPDLNLILLHSRFPLVQRQEIEEKILNQYGKPSPKVTRPRRGIVIGTQVLEQSLDLDFDLMVTDLAPIDLILQRAGRCRHRSNKQIYSTACQSPP